ncbi:possible chromate resistance protein [Halalkalibacter wakoensis JCM 9140]|uniref:Possible chromate resistance protein n=1 Tax=Halalkalibacter wakoensis JCM 9140 TaxID=1236970 RepID=W4Q4N1_9BACI|nr:Chromate resistance protein ChrB [Halalkalibacter wakoensis]GAE26673.1 possible chromate resistance protein [Halalkalibacter wakoensis JCM 9140]
MIIWLHLTYKIPRKPSSPRVKVWRKLKSLGAFHLHETTWLLPKNPYTYEQFQWLTVEIKDLGGEAAMWQSHLILGFTDEELSQLFIQQINVRYVELLKQLNDQNIDLISLSKKYQRIKTIDYFKSPLELEVREKIRQRRSELK